MDAATRRACVRVGRRGRRDMMVVREQELRRSLYSPSPGNGRAGTCKLPRQPLRWPFPRLQLSAFPRLETLKRLAPVVRGFFDSSTIKNASDENFVGAPLDSTDAGPAMVSLSSLTSPVRHPYLVTYKGTGLVDSDGVPFDVEDDEEGDATWALGTYRHVLASCFITSVFSMFLLFSNRSLCLLDQSLLGRRCSFCRGTSL